jgi:hypothetical protein
LTEWIIGVQCGVRPESARSGQSKTGSRSSRIQRGISQINLMRRLQNSRFFISERLSEPVFILDGIASEWLFATGFWARINRSMGTMYDQYEEDEAAPAHIDQIAVQMCREIGELEALMKM